MKAIIHHQEAITKDKPGSPAEPQFSLGLHWGVFLTSRPLVTPTAPAAAVPRPPGPGAACAAQLSAPAPGRGPQRPRHRARRGHRARLCPPRPLRQRPLHQRRHLLLDYAAVSPCPGTPPARGHPKPSGAEGGRGGSLHRRLALPGPAMGRAGSGRH